MVKDSLVSLLTAFTRSQKKLEKDYDILVTLGAQNILTAVTAEIIPTTALVRLTHPCQLKSKTPAPVTSHQTVSEAFATIMGHNFQYLTQWEDTARDLGRTSRACTRSASPYAECARRCPCFATPSRNRSEAHWADEMRWAAGELGLARDLDVFISEGLSAVTDKIPLSGCEGLLRLAERRRARTYEEQVRAMLDSDRYRDFKTGFQSWYEGREWEKAELKKKQAKCLAKNLVPFSRELMDKQERKVLAAGSHVDRNRRRGDAPAAHRMQEAALRRRVLPPPVRGHGRLHRPHEGGAGSSGTHERRGRHAAACSRS